MIATVSASWPSPSFLIEAERKEDDNENKYMQSEIFICLGIHRARWALKCAMYGVYDKVRLNIILEKIK